MGNTQKLILFIRGNAISGAPIITGTSQFNFCYKADSGLCLYLLFDTQKVDMSRKVSEGLQHS
jgi:hypothetical protein